jgi:CRP-like cAMP-binding protein
MAKSDLENAVGQLHVVEFEAGDTITTQGDHADTFFVIDRGECIVEVDGQQVSKMSAGRSFGENALLRDSSRAATIKAVCRVKCLTMTRQAFTDLIKERERRECMVRGAKIFETFTDDQIAKLAGILERER